MPRISGSSDEIISTARPRSASSCMSAWISDFEPTSTPCVGSSRMSTFGEIASHRASATFCWLPPDSDSTSDATDAGLDPQLVHVPLRLAPFARAIDQPAAGDRGEAREAHVLVDRHFRDDPVLFPIFRKIADAGVDGAAGRSHVDRTAVHQHVARVGGRQAEHGLRELGAARPDEPREPDDFAAANLERHILHTGSPARDAAQLERDLAERHAPLRKNRRQLAADHQIDQRRALQAVARVRADRARRRAAR